MDTSFEQLVIARLGELDLKIDGLVGQVAELKGAREEFLRHSERKSTLISAVVSGIVAALVSLLPVRHN